MEETQQPPQIKEIVERVECDLYEALKDRLNRPYGYEWLHSWTAQANLNYIVNDQAQLVPGAVITQPLNLVSIPNKVSNFAQSWNVGVGGQASDTATRNDTFAFTVSFEELKDKFDNSPHGCSFPENGGLRSELGLKEWLSSALSPADSNQLSIGFHKTPKVGAGTIAVKDAIAKVVGSPPTGSASIPLVNGRPSCAPITKAPGAKKISKADRAFGDALCYLRYIGDSKYIDFEKLDGDQVKIITQAIAAIQTAIRINIEENGKNGLPTDGIEKTAILLTAFVDPPIDTISHQIQFVLVWGLNASPSWTLVNFKGPSPSTGSLISGMTTRTDTLNIVLGSPSSEDAQLAVNALQIGTAVANSINTGH